MLAHLLFYLGPQGPWPVGSEYQWWVLLVLVYLPAIMVVLGRSNETDDQTWGRTDAMGSPLGPTRSTP
jgi:hypothetical protein